MSEVNLQVSRRQDSGKGAAKRLRRQGEIPGIYYHHGQDALSLAVNVKSFRAVAARENNVIDLDFGDGKLLPSIIREVQFDPVSSAPLHVDFLGVSLDEKVVVEIPIHVIGASAAIKEKGGILQVLQRTIEVESLPLDIPEFIEVDISNLDIHDAIYVRDLKHDKVEVIGEPDGVVVTILPPRLEAEEAPAVAEEEVAEPEVVGRGKKEKEEEAAEE